MTQISIPMDLPTKISTRTHCAAGCASCSLGAVVSAGGWQGDRQVLQVRKSCLRSSSFIWCCRTGVRTQVPSLSLCHLRFSLRLVSPILPMPCAAGHTKMDLYCILGPA